MRQRPICRVKPFYVTDRAAIQRFDWLEEFRPHPLWRGGVLQTLSIKLASSGFDPLAWPGRRTFDIEDDSTPPDTLSGIWLPSDHASPKRTVVVFHGMGGHATSGYMCGMAKALLTADHGVVLWNNRGAGHSAASCRRLHHPGYTDDVRRLVRHLREKES